MEILKRFQAGRHVRLLQSSKRPTDAALIEARAQLAAMGAPAVRAIFSALTTESATPTTLEVLSGMVNQDTLPAFLEGLRSGQLHIEQTATLVLARSATFDVTQLFALFADPRVPRARLETILDAQAVNVHPTALLRVLPALGKEARNTAYRMLERTADSSILAEALDMAKHPEWWIRLHVAKLLARLPGPAANAAMTKLVRDENGAVRIEAVRAVQRMQAREAIPALCTRLRDQDLKVQTAAIEALVGLADVSAVPHLLDALKDESEYVRRGAVEVLNQVVTPEAIKDLVTALKDADWWVRVRAADALGTLGGPKVVDAVMELTRDPDEFARRYSIEILNTVPDARAVPVLIEALEDEDWWVRERAVDALGKTGVPEAVDPLLRMMSRDSRAVPLCVRALGSIGGERVVEPLSRLAESSDTDIRREAIQALTSLLTRELPEGARQSVVAVLDKAGVRTVRQVLKPMSVRGGKHPEAAPAGAPAPGAPANAPATPDAAAAGANAPAGANTPAAEAARLHFQKLAPGTELLGRFRIAQRIGGGGFGTVYQVEDILVKETLVLKVLSPQLSLDPTMIKRFVQELKLTRRITHPNVIRIHDLLDLDGAHAISMEHFAARDLGALLRQEGPLSPARAIHVAEQTLEGLVAAHAAGVYHRDIKPANLLVGDGDQVKIVDFGLASMSHSSHSRLTQSGILVGTPEYISPEQITGTDVDARSDLYSLGVVLYEAMSGRQPFSGATAVNVLFQHLEATVPPLSSVAAGIPPAVNDIVMKAMARHPHDRYASAAVMLEAVRAAA
jgi:serine/threonine-protein kinase